MGAFDQVVFDSAKPSALARFWANVLEGYRVRDYDDAEIARLAALGFTPETDPAVIVDGPGPSLCFQQVDAPGATRGRVHLDVAVKDRAREVARLRALGASVVREAADLTVMCDPEGNHFCVVHKP